MLSPVPGLSYLKVLTPSGREVPRPHATPAPDSSAAPDPDPAAVAPLITVALQAAFGMRPVQRLPRRTFSDTVRARLQARLRSSPVRGPVALRSLRVAGTEVFGTCAAQDRIFAFTAVVAEGRLESFRVC